MVSSEWLFFFSLISNWKVKNDEKCDEIELLDFVSCLLLIQSVILSVHQVKLVSRKKERKLESCSKRIFGAVFKAKTIAQLHIYVNICVIIEKLKTIPNKWKEKKTETVKLHTIRAKAWRYLDYRHSLIVSYSHHKRTYMTFAHCRKFSCQRSSYKWPIIVLSLSFETYAAKERSPKKKNAHTMNRIWNVYLILKFWISMREIVKNYYYYSPIQCMFFVLFENLFFNSFQRKSSKAIEWMTLLVSLLLPIILTFNSRTDVFENRSTIS